MLLNILRKYKKIVSLFYFRFRFNLDNKSGKEQSEYISNIFPFFNEAINVKVMIE